MSEYICRSCSINLIKDVNWYTSLAITNNKICKKCCNLNVKKNSNKIENKIKAVNKRAIRKKEVITYYGGKCECCGIDNITLLSIDHIKGGGNIERKNLHISAGQQFYLWLKTNNYPIGYRVLCYNCNCSLGYYKYCPHTQIGKNKIFKSNSIIKSGFCRICNANLNLINQYYTHLKNNKNICKSCFQQSESNRNLNIKKKLLIKYGSKCIECNEKHFEFLCIDHINNDGSIERKKISNRKLFKKLLKEDKSDKYQILCYNCNSFKEYYIRRNLNIEVK